jgi:hypothetical protein
LPQCRLVLKVPRIVREGEDVDLMPGPPHGTYLMKSTDLVAFIGRIRNAVAKVQDSHGNGW